jgi:hypothetical protein
MHNPVQALICLNGMRGLAHPAHLALPAHSHQLTPECPPELIYLIWFMPLLKSI